MILRLVVCLAFLCLLLRESISIAAGETLVPAGAVWRYLPITNDIGTVWREFDYDDSFWASGPAQLGYGDQDEATVIPFHWDQQGGKNISTYFRHAFMVTHAARYTNLHIRLLRDDGAVVHLNGVELFRNNMPEGEVFHATRAIISIASPEENTVFVPTNVPTTLLREGMNSVAVEIHQYSPASADVSFDMEIIGEAPPPSRPPVVTLTAPFPGAAFARDADIAITATASDPDGTVAFVEFFANSNRLGTVSSPPFSIVWSNVPAGPHVIHARATDSSGVQSDSPPVLVGVGGFSLVHTGAVWKYLDDQTDPGTAWREPDFDDTGWSNGVAPLGFGDGDEATVIRWKIDDVPIITAYFRLQFVVPKPEAFSSVLLRLLRDDGAVVYLNGEEIFRSNMPPGPVDYRTYATYSVGTGPEENTIYFPTNFSSQFLRKGTNTLAVEVHQITQHSSTDLSFDCALLGFLTAGNERVKIQRDPNGIAVGHPAWSDRFILESTDSLTPPVRWTKVTNAVPFSDWRWIEFLYGVTNGNRFFRFREE